MFAISDTLLPALRYRLSLLSEMLVGSVTLLARLTVTMVVARYPFDVIAVIVVSPPVSA
jgi:hypothetical protein